MPLISYKSHFLFINKFYMYLNDNFSSMTYEFSVIKILCISWKMHAGIGVQREDYNTVLNYCLYASLSSLLLLGEIHATLL